MHVHVQAPTGQAKFWLEPSVELAKRFGLTPRAINMLTKIIKERRSEIVRAWQTHFGRQS
jgi:hypothetical protein